MSAEIIYNTYDNEASIVHDDIVNDKVLKVVTAPFGNSNTKDVLEYPLAENLLEVQSYGFSQFIKTSFLVRKAEVILNIDDEDIVVAEAENIEMNYWHRLEGFFTMDELKKVDFNNATLRLRITKAFNDPEVYIYRPCLTKGDTIPDWFPSLEEIMGDIVESQSSLFVDKRLENLASDLTEIEQDEVKGKLGIVNYIDKLESSHSESQYILLADGTRVDPQTLIEEKEIVTYNSSNPRPAIGEEGKLYIDTDTDKAYLWDETTQDYIGIGVIDLSNYYDQQDVDTLLADKLDLDMNNLAGDLTEQEQDTIKTKLGISLNEGLATDMSNLDNDILEADRKVIREKLGAAYEGYNNTNSGILSGSVGGGGNINSGDASGSVGGSINNNSGGTSASVGGTNNENSGVRSASVGGTNNKNSGVRSASVGGSNLENKSQSETSRGQFNLSESNHADSATEWHDDDLIESVGGGTNSGNRLNLFARYKSGAFYWVKKTLSSITNAVKGFHAADEDGRLNYHNGTEWKKYLLEGEEGEDVDLSNYYDQQEVDGLLDDKEDKFTKNTAFNKNFGAGTNDVARGNHTHSELHTHSNKSTLDGITPAKIDEWDSKAEGDHTHSELHTHSNKSTLDTITEQDLADYLEAHKKTVTGVSFTGDVNKTLTITRQDGTTLTASFEDKEGDGGGVTDGVLNTLEFNDATGVLTATVLNGTNEIPIDVNLDGRYSLITHTHDLSDVSGLQDALDSKVDKVAGKELSDNNYTSAEKAKLAGIAAQATKNETDAYLLARANHTGSQGMSTITGLEDKLQDMSLGIQTAQSDAEDALDLANLKEDAFTKNTAFNKDFGTGPNEVARGDHAHSQYLTTSAFDARKQFIGTYANPDTTQNIMISGTKEGDEAIITYQGANMPTIFHRDSAISKLNFIDMGIDFVPNQLCRIYLHIVERDFGTNEMYIDITVKPITLLS